MWLRLRMFQSALRTKLARRDQAALNLATYAGMRIHGCCGPVKDSLHAVRLRRTTSIWSSCKGLLPSCKAPSMVRHTSYRYCFHAGLIVGTRKRAPPGTMLELNGGYDESPAEDSDGPAAGRRQRAQNRAGEL